MSIGYIIIIAAITAIVVAFLGIVIVAMFGDKWEDMKFRKHLHQRDLLIERTKKVEKEASELHYRIPGDDHTKAFRDILFEAQSLLRDGRRELGKPTRVVESLEEEFTRLKEEGYTPDVEGIKAKNREERKKGREAAEKQQLGDNVPSASGTDEPSIKIKL